VMARRLSTLVKVRSRRTWTQWLGIVAFALAPTAIYGGTAMSEPPSDKFDFQYFESLNIDRGTLDKFVKQLPPGHETPEALRAAQAAAAQDYLNEKFSPGTPASAVVDSVTAAGAKCQFAKDDRGKGAMPSEYFYWCQYAHGLLVMTEWQVTIFTDKDGKSVTTIYVGYGLTGL
jgi:hypothetical protein